MRERAEDIPILLPLLLLVLWRHGEYHRDGGGRRKQCRRCLSASRFDSNRSERTSPPPAFAFLSAYPSHGFTAHPHTSVRRTRLTPDTYKNTTAQSRKPLFLKKTCPHFPLLSSFFSFKRNYHPLPFYLLLFCSRPPSPPTPRPF